MKISQLIATLLIAIGTFPTGVASQNVYRCGNAYSQKPCADGVAVDVQDTRTPEQKADADALIKRDSAAANTMEKARLKEEAKLRVDNAKFAAAAAKNASAKPKSEGTGGSASAHKTKAKKKPTHSKKESDYFNTRAAPEKPKKAASTSR